MTAIARRFYAVRRRLASHWPLWIALACWPLLLTGRLSSTAVSRGELPALSIATLLAAVLYGVQARDVMVFVGVPAVLAATAFAAVWIAARRASGIDPLHALRYE